MTDREYLELAAKAAGVEIDAIDAQHDPQDWVAWNPLTNDGDALRLAVKLKMRIGIDAIPVGYVVVMSDDPFRKDIHEQIDDPYAATRRAIVWAAAEIGKKMAGGE
jgi:hypothetical protein